MDTIDNKTCVKILHHERVPVHVIRHCVKVSQVACKIGSDLIQKGHGLDMDIIRAGALLHDIAKIKALKLGGDHAEIGARILEAQGYERIARIVRHHVYLPRPVEKQRHLSEELVVNYADKRVMHTKVVGLEERFADLVARYGTNKDAMRKINELYHQARLMEQMIFSRLDLRPEDI